MWMRLGGWGLRRGRGGRWGGEMRCRSVGCGGYNELDSPFSVIVGLDYLGLQRRGWMKRRFAKEGDGQALGR